MPYPLLADESWRAMNAASLKVALLYALGELLRSEKQATGDAVFTEEEVQSRVAVVATSIETIDSREILAASLKEWETLLGAHATAYLEESLASRVKRLLGHPASVPHAVMPPEGPSGRH